jgi:WD40 repeat protein
MLAAGAGDGSVRLFRFDGHASCNSVENARKATGAGRVAAAPHGRRDARSGGNRRPSVAANHKPPPELEKVKDGILPGHSGLVMAVAFDRVGDRLASTAMDGSVRVWGPKTDGFSLAELRSKSDNGEAISLPADVTTVVISPDSTSIAAGDVGGNIHLWTPQSEYPEPQMQAATRTWHHAHSTAIRSLAYIRAENGLTLVSGGDDGALNSWDVGTGKNIARRMSDNAKPVRAIAVSPDGKMLAAGSSDGSVRIWNPKTLAPLRLIDKPKGWESQDQLSAVGFSPDTKYLIIASSDLRLVPLGETDAEPIGAAEPKMLVGHADDITSVSQLRIGDYGRVLSAGKDGAVLFWNLEELRKRNGTFYLREPDNFEYRMKDPDGKRLTAMDVSANGRLILTGGEGGQVQLWDPSNRELTVPRVKGHDGNIKAVAVAPDASFFVTAEARKILLWPGPDRWADIICHKLSRNMSIQQWTEWVLGALKSDLEYDDQCEGLSK